MPRFTTETPSVYETFTRPIAMDITRTVGRLMHLPSVTEILFVGNTGQPLQSGATLNYEGAPSKFPSGSRIQVTLSESTEEQSILSENSFQENAPVCWRDACLGVRLRPIYTSAVLTLRFEVQSRSRVEAEKLRDEYRMRTAMGRQQILHTLTYVYGIPAEELTLLQQIHTQREAVAGYGDTFETWLRQHEVSPPNTPVRLKQVTNLAGGGASWVFSERAVSVQGTFDFRIAPEAPDRNDENGMYTCPIEYRVRVDKPIAMSMDYPLVVHNQLIPAIYHGKVSVGGTIPDPYSQGRLYSDKTTEIFSQMILNRTLRNHKLMGGVRYPAFDDWLPAAVPQHTSTLYAAMVQVDLTDPTAVCDLMHLDGVTIDGDLRQYMASCRQKLGQINLSAIHVSLYRGTQWLGDQAIAISGDLKVTATQPMSPRERYHIRIAILNDLILLPASERFALRTQGAACQKILLTLQEGMRYQRYVPKLAGPRQIMPDSLLLMASNRINLHKRQRQTLLEVALPQTVGNFFIIADRMSDYAPDETRGIPAAATPINRNPYYQPLEQGCG